MKNLIIFDIETDLDTEAVCRGLKLPLNDEAAAREKIGDDFPRLPFHRIVAIGRLEAFWDEKRALWQVGQIACNDANHMSEAEIIQSFDSRINDLNLCLSLTMERASICRCCAIAR